MITNTFAAIQISFRHLTLLSFVMRIKQRFLCGIIISFSITLNAQNLTAFPINVGDQLEYLNKIPPDTLVFLQKETKDTLYSLGPDTAYTFSDTITIDSISNQQLYLTNQNFIKTVVQLLEFKGASEARSEGNENETSSEIESEETTPEEKTQEELIYESGVNLAGRYHIYKLIKVGNNFKIELCRSSISNGRVQLSCQLSNVPLIGDYDCVEHFRVIFIEQLKVLYSNDPDSIPSPELTDILNFLETPQGSDRLQSLCNAGKEKNETKAIAAAEKDRSTEINERVNEVRTELAIQLENLKRENSGIMTLKGSVKVPYCDSIKCSDEQPRKELEFKPKSVWFKTDFYRVSDIRIDGHLFLNPKDSIPYSLVNTKFGFSIDGLIGGNNKRYWIEEEQLEINGQTCYNAKFFIGEILDYQPKEGTFSKFFANQEYEIPSPDSIAIIKKRSINDFISATIFTDAFGFIDEAPNNVLQTEVTAYIPLNRRNFKIWNWLPEMSGTFNISLINGFGENGKFVKPNFVQESKITETVDSLGNPDFDTAFVDVGYLNAVDFLRNSDIDFNWRFKVLTLEMKRWSTFFNLELGYRLFRARVDVNIDPVEVETRSKFIHSPELNLSFHIRPDWILGANVQAGIHYFTTFQRGLPDVLEFEINDIEGDKAENRWVFRNEFNAYAYISSKRKSGVFFRYRGYHGFTKFGVRQKTQYYPTILIGYATNLAALIRGEK